MDYMVYIHTNLINEKKYVGITSLTPERRWQKGYGYHRNAHFYSAILQYGWDNFSHEILFEGLSKEAACSKEIELIEKYKTNDPRFGYNNSTGGEFGSLGCHLSEEVRKRLSEQAKLRIGEMSPMYGKHHSEQSKKKMSESKKGKQTGENNPFYNKKHSEETRKRLSECRKGAKHTDETKAKMSETRRGVQTGRTGAKAYNSIPVICVETSIVYSCAAEAGRELGLPRTNITRVCKGKGKTAGGYHWKYVI